MILVEVYPIKQLLYPYQVEGYQKLLIAVETIQEHSQPLEQVHIP